MSFPSKTELLSLDAGAFERSFESGDFNIVRLVSEVIRQIKTEDKDGFQLRAVISMAPESKLLERAKQLDRERLEGNSRGPLHGIPIILKAWLDINRFWSSRFSQPGYLANAQLCRTVWQPILI